MTDLLRPLNMIEKAIIVKNLTKQFDDTLAVNNINFAINTGTTVGLLGSNGCGKSTTLGMILGLIKPSSGSVVINNNNIENNRVASLENMNFVSPYIDLPKKLTVKENLNVYGRLYGVKNLNDKVADIMNKLDLTNLSSKKTGELSSGQKNRVGLAKSIINNPKILLLDEPTASLDPDVGDVIRSFIQDYTYNNKATILLASHNMNEVERLCDKVMMMKKGKIIDHGKCDELISKHGRKNLEEVFLKIARE